MSQETNQLLDPNCDIIQMVKLPEKTFKLLWLNMFKLWMEKMDRMTGWINFGIRLEVIVKNNKNARNETTEEVISNALIDSSADLTHPKRESVIFKLG